MYTFTTWYSGERYRTIMVLLFSFADDMMVKLGYPAANWLPIFKDKRQEYPSTGIEGNQTMLVARPKLRLLFHYTKKSATCFGPIYICPTSTGKSRASLMYGILMGPLKTSHVETCEVLGGPIRIPY